MKWRAKISNGGGQEPLPPCWRPPCLSFKKNWVILERVKARKFQIFSILEKLITNIAEQFGDFFLKKQKQLLLFPQNPFHCVDQRCSGKVSELCWAFSLIIVGSNSSFTDEGGVVELRQLDTTGCGRGQNSCEGN